MKRIKEKIYKFIPNISSNILVLSIMIAIIALMAVLSWLITCGIIYLICMCFGLSFNILIATGVWLVLGLLNIL